LFSHAISRLCHLPAVTTWTVAGLILLLAAAVANHKSEKSPAASTTRGWVLLSGFLIVCGLLGPSDLGEAHGGMLRERILLLGFATLIPIMKARLTPLRGTTLIAAVGLGALMVACVLQVAAVWSYARTSNRSAGEFMEAKPFIGTGQRVAVLIVEPETICEPKPLLHVADLLGIETGNVMWNNYRPGLYYFPVQFRDVGNRDLFYVRGIPEFTYQRIEQQDLDDWGDLLSDIEARTDELVVWTRNAELDDIDSEWLDDDPVFENDNVRVFRHRDRKSDE